MISSSRPRIEPQKPIASDGVLTTRSQKLMALTSGWTMRLFESEELHLVPVWWNCTTSMAADAPDHTGLDCGVKIGQNGRLPVRCTPRFSFAYLIRSWPLTEVCLSWQIWHVCPSPSTRFRSMMSSPRMQPNISSTMLN